MASSCYVWSHTFHLRATSDDVDMEKQKCYFCGSARKRNLKVRRILNFKEHRVDSFVICFRCEMLEAKGKLHQFDSRHDNFPSDKKRYKTKKQQVDTQRYKTNHDTA